MMKDCVVWVQEPSYFTGSEVRMRDPDQPAMTFAVAFKGVSCADADSVPLMLMQQMLGSWNKNSPYGDASASRALHPTMIHVSVALHRERRSTEPTEHVKLAVLNLSGLYSQIHPVTTCRQLFASAKQVTQHESN